MKLSESLRGHLINPDRDSIGCGGGCMKSVLQACAYAAEYAGNFIASLTELEKELNKIGYNVIYCFPERAAGKNWCEKIRKRTKVYFLPEAKARILPKTYRIFRRIYKENEIAVLHSHFELYDMPATLTAPRNVKCFWHLHDPLTLSGTNRDLLWKIQYGKVGKRATLISVADYYRRFVISLGFPEEQTCVLRNGIDLERIKTESVRSEKKYDFLTFGWDFHRKGDDLILQACDRLWKDGYRFKILLNGNEKTWGPLEEYLEGRVPEYLERENPKENVSELFEEARVFIQASRRETFSYAVCEAAYAGLPVICSDIPGVEWAHDIESVIFFESENADDLYHQMKSFLDGKKLENHTIEKSIEKISELYSLYCWAQKILNIYNC